MNAKKFNGIAIALAWPQTYCKQPGSWYDKITGYLGINRNNYYKAGHAALVLIDSNNAKCYYFDFGRYHAPYQYGRVRSAITDHELELYIKPIFSKDKSRLGNYTEILNALQHNSACHGEGKLHASYCEIVFESAYSKALQMQNLGSIPYGPFKYNASNCSRFVNTVIYSGKPKLFNKLRLKYFAPFTPTPISNIIALKYHIEIPKSFKKITFKPIKKLDKKILTSTLQQPKRNSKIPKNAQWLSGEGAGSWFNFDTEGKFLKVIRYSPSGNVECSGLYENKAIKLSSSFKNLKISYPSNCKEISLINSEKALTFLRVH